MPAVFISYSHKDVEVARKLKQRLEEYQFDVFMDTSTIKTGDRWKNLILKGVEDCHAFALLLSHQSALSMWVMRELTYALEFEKPIFPLLLEGDPWPLIQGLHCAKSTDELLLALRRLTQLYVCHAPGEKDFAADLKQKLTGLGVTLWEGGLSAANSSSVMLLAVSPESMKSEEIKKQWEAFDAAGATIIPLLVRHTSVPARLRNKQPYVDFLNQDYGIAFAQLCDVLDALHVNLKEHESVSIPPQPPLPLNSVDMLRTAQKEVWMSGLTLDVFSRHDGMLSGALRDNPALKVKLIMLELNSRLANEVGAWTSINQPRFNELPTNQKFEDWASRQEPALTIEGRWVAKRLYQSQQLLQSIQKQFPDRIEIHTLSHRLGMGYFIIDPHSEQNEGMLTATPYYYQIDKAKATRSGHYTTTPIFLSKSSSKESDLWWFDEYVQEFDRLWKDTDPWKPVVG